jgi:hypothetical protein
MIMDKGNKYKKDSKGHKKNSNLDNLVLCGSNIMETIMVNSYIIKSGLTAEEYMEEQRKKREENPEQFLKEEGEKKRIEVLPARDVEILNAMVDVMEYEDVAEEELGDIKELLLKHFERKQKGERKESDDSNQ